MSLLVLVIMVVIGITAVVASVHLTGGTITATLTDAAEAVDRFHQDFENETVEKVVLTDDHQTAFLWLDNARMGVVTAIGDRYLTRLFAPQDIRGLERIGDKTLEFRVADLTWRGGSFGFATDKDCADVLQALSGPAQG